MAKKALAKPAGMTEQEFRQVEASHRLMQAVRAALKSPKLPIRELTVATDVDGGVSLFGLTASEGVKRRADEIVRTIPGVTQVSNTIIVLAEVNPGPG